MAMMDRHLDRGVMLDRLPIVNSARPSDTGAVTVLNMNVSPPKALKTKASESYWKRLETILVSVFVD